MKIYVASSWRNSYQSCAVRDLRAAGFEVYDFKNPATGEHGFHWSQIDSEWETWTPGQLSNALRDPIAVDGFNVDMNALKDADAVVLVLPCGRSAHLEAGYAAGTNKLVYIYSPESCEPELMYRMTEGVFAHLGMIIFLLGRKNKLQRYNKERQKGGLTQ